MSPGFANISRQNESDKKGGWTAAFLRKYLNSSAECSFQHNSQFHCTEEPKIVVWLVYDVHAWVKMKKSIENDYRSQETKIDDKFQPLVRICYM